MISQSATTFLYHITPHSLCADREQKNGIEREKLQQSTS